MGKDRISFLLVMLLLMLFLTACAPGPTPTAPSGVEPTSTPKPVEPTPTPRPPPDVEPQPGAAFAGPIEITGKASSATIAFTISEDGASIVSVGVSLTDVKCDGFSAGNLTQRSQGSFSVAEGRIAISSKSLGEFEGRFLSPTEARGTAKLTLEIPFGGGTCDLGTWDWSATAR